MAPGSSATGARPLRRDTTAAAAAAQGCAAEGPTDAPSTAVRPARLRIEYMSNTEVRSQTLSQWCDWPPVCLQRCGCRRPAAHGSPPRGQTITTAEHACTAACNTPQAATLSWFVYFTTLLLVVGVVVLVLLKFNVRDSDALFRNKAW